MFGFGNIFCGHSYPQPRSSRSMPMSHRWKLPCSAGCGVCYRQLLDSDFYPHMAVLFRQLKENGVAIWPHRKSGGTQSLHETLYWGQCRCNHGASGQCLSNLPKYLSHRTPPSTMKAPVSRSMTESGLSSQLRGSMTHSYAFIQGPSIDSHTSSSEINFRTSIWSSGSSTKPLEPAPTATWNTSMTTSW